MKPVDLSLTISESIPSFPGSTTSKLIDWSDIEHDGYNLELLFLNPHTGTHLDALFHFVKNGLKIRQIPLNRFLGKAVLIKLKKLENTSITKSDITSFKKRMAKFQIILQSFSLQIGKKI